MKPARVGLVTLIVLAVATLFLRPLAAGLFLAGSILVAPVLGAAILLCVGDLTGGRWRSANAATFLALARPYPWVVGGAAVIAIGAAATFPPLSAPPDKVPAIYFAPWAFAVRAVLILLAWTALCRVAIAREPNLARSAAALVAFTVATIFASYDWLLSLDAPLSSTVYPAVLVITHIAAALALAMALTPIGRDADQCDDLAQLGIAAVLGVLYLAFMQYLVMWGGNLPDRAVYFVRRTTLAWEALLFIALIFGAAVPLALLSFRRLRRDARSVRVAGWSALAGIVAFQVWQVAPGLDLSLFPALTAAILVLVGAGVALRVPTAAHRHV